MGKLFWQVEKLFWQVDKLFWQVDKLFWQVEKLFWQVEKNILVDKLSTMKCEEFIFSDWSPPDNPIQSERANS